ncbi:hypothetical protein ACTI_40920 [Actinoplanes sp. OR16]|uniref:DUF3068 domain-containing protein n=1 Tax=Actinoplanes sp. OR16 TaxID=946334 RepID=UPI000F70DD0D|nr:DUF3068 domain-containing protein [Actinoplanes sp. OR16]BBH67407.1 hypothetical protein ACTI_40920 [Actinoplanes sp. OR16]
MRSRVLGTVLFGLGVLAIVFAAGLYFVVAPKAAQLPYDMEPTQSVAEAQNATFLQVTSGEAKINHGALRSTVTVQPDAKETANLEGDLDGTAIVWLAGQDVVNTSLNSERVSAYSTRLAVDRETGAAVPWDGAWLDTGNQEKIDYSGHMYKFPFGTEKKAYPIYDRDIREAQPAEFVKTEEIAGLETYQFTQKIVDGRQQLDPTQLSLLVNQLLDPTATTAEVVYNNTRTVWVEPVTGQFIRVSEEQSKELVGNNGQRVTLLDADFTYTEDTIERSAAAASDNRQKLQLVGLWGPLVLGLIGLILAVVGIIITVRSGRSATGVPAQSGGDHDDLDEGDGKPATAGSHRAEG